MSGASPGASAVLHAQSLQEAQHKTKGPPAQASSVENWAHFQIFKVFAMIFLACVLLLKFIIDSTEKFSLMDYRNTHEAEEITIF